MVCFFPFQILVFLAKFGDFFVEFDEIHYLASVIVVSLYSDLCLIGDAAVWRYVQFSRRYTTVKFQLILYCHAHSLSSKLMFVVPSISCRLLVFVAAPSYFVLLDEVFFCCCVLLFAYARAAVWCCLLPFVDFWSYLMLITLIFDGICSYLLLFTLILLLFAPIGWCCLLPYVAVYSYFIMFTFI